MPTLGAPSRGERNGGAGDISVSLTVATAGNSVIVLTASIDTNQSAPSAITGIPGVTFQKLAEGATAGQTAYLHYRGSPTIWKADNVPAGTYTITAAFASSADLFGCIVAQECSPCTSVESAIASGTGSAGALPAMGVSNGSLVLGMLHSNPNATDAGFVPPPGWTRQDVRQDGQSATSFDAAVLSATADVTLSGGWSWTYSAEWSLAVVELVDSNQCRALVWSGASREELPTSDTVDSPGNSDHGAFDGLDADTHGQYLNEARGDGRYMAKVHGHAPSVIGLSGAEVGDVAVWDGAKWAPARAGLLVGLTRRATAQASSSVVTLAAAPELSMYLEANGVYVVDAIVAFQTAATGTGLNLGLSTPAGCRNLVEISVPIASGAAASALRTIFPNASTASNAGNVLGTGVTAANSTHTARISGLLVNGATAGALQVQFATEVARSAVTILADSQITLTRIA